MICPSFHTETATVHDNLTEKKLYYYRVIRTCSEHLAKFVNDKRKFFSCKYLQFIMKHTRMLHVSGIKILRHNALSGYNYVNQHCPFLGTLPLASQAASHKRRLPRRGKHAVASGSAGSETLRLERHL